MGLNAILLTRNAVKYSKDFSVPVIAGGSSDNDGYACMGVWANNLTLESFHQDKLLLCTSLNPTGSFRGCTKCILFLLMDVAARRFDCELHAMSVCASTFGFHSFVRAISAGFSPVTDAGPSQEKG